MKKTNNNKTSKINGFSRFNIKDRQRRISQDYEVFKNADNFLGINGDIADVMVENAIGVFGLPLGVALNFIVNGHEMLIPMVTEEPSVIAGASNAAKMARAGGGFKATSDFSFTIAQIELLDFDDYAEKNILDSTKELLELANSCQEELVSLGGGAREIVIRNNVGMPNRMVVHLTVDCKDAMGANIVNTMAEKISGLLEKLSGARSGLKIVTNLADRRLAVATCRIPFFALEREGFSGDKVALGIVRASLFAHDDPYRAATHNKGIFNGIDAVLIATGNDWRAVEAGGHAWAAKNGAYNALSSWKIENNKLCGRLTLPMAVGITGGAGGVHPQAKQCIRMMKITKASALAQITASVGLASNLAALAALGSEGIQKGHMRLHKKKHQ